MNVHEVGDALTTFATTRQSVVLSLSGRWGRGKTYLWLRTVGAAAVEKRLAYETYSYVSLFGLRTLDEVKDAVFANGMSRRQVAAEFKERAVVEAVAKPLRVWLAKMSGRFPVAREGWKWIHGRLPKFRWREDVPAVLTGKDFGQIARAVSQRYVYSYLVCFDDLERAGEDLNLWDVFGYASLLRDERKCSVLIILNSDELKEKHQSAYKSLREKVLDFELQYDPDVADCVELVFPGEAEQWRAVKQSCSQLGVQNIRILQRIKRTLLKFVGAFGGDVGAAREWLNRRLPLLVFSYYNNEDRYPNLDFVLASHGVDMLVRHAEGKPKPEDRADWIDWLNEYGSEAIPVLDELLATYLRTGLLPADDVGAALREVDLTASLVRAESEFSQAWDSYHNSFNDDEQELLASLRRTLRGVYVSQSPGNVSNTTMLFRSLGRGDEADAIVEEYVATLKAHAPEKLDLRTYPFRDRMADRKLVEAMERERVDLEQPVPLAEAVGSLLGGQSWKSVHAGALEAAEVEDFVALLHELRGRELRAAVDSILAYSAVGAPDANIVRRKFAEAMRRVAGESRLNAMRMERFSIPDLPPPT